MKRRTRLIVKLAACAVIVASVVLARVFSDDGVGSFGVGQAALFLAFAVASITLFVVVVFDFDSWVDTVPPVPKRVLRRIFGRGARTVVRAVTLVLAWYGAAMTWVWSRVGAALGLVAARAARRVTWFWSWVARAESAVLTRVGQGLTVLWVLVLRGAVRTGEGLTLLWVWAVRGGVRGLVSYRAVMHRLWSTVGHGFVWTLARAGEGLTLLWVWAVRGGVRALVRYRAAMQWLWSTTAHGFRWAAMRIGTALRVGWAGLVRGAASTIVRGRSGIKHAWLAVAGRGDEPTPKPIRRWYTATVDAAFGIPPDGTSIDVFGGRAAPARRDSEKVGATAGARPRTGDDAVL